MSCINDSVATLESSGNLPEVSNESRVWRSLFRTGNAHQFQIFRIFMDIWIFVYVPKFEAIKTYQTYMCSMVL